MALSARKRSARSRFFVLNQVSLPAGSQWLETGQVPLPHDVEQRRPGRPAMRPAGRRQAPAGGDLHYDHRTFGNAPLQVGNGPPSFALRESYGDSLPEN